MIPLHSVVQFVEGTNIKGLTIIVVLVTDILIVGNSITQPASAFRNVPFGAPFGAPLPYDYCMHFFGQQNFRNVPFGSPFELPFGTYDYCMQHFFAQHKFGNEPFELPFP
jgi:hypothetical protein